MLASARVLSSFECSPAVYLVVPASLRVLFCTECSQVGFFAWRWSAHACSSVTRAVLRVELFSPCVLFYTWCSQAVCCVLLDSPHMFFCIECRRAIFSVVLASPRVLFCTVCSRAVCSRAVCSVVLGCLHVALLCRVVFSAWCWSAHACSSVPRGAGQPMQSSYFSAEC